MTNSAVRRFCAAVAAAGLLLLCGGCSLDVEGFLRPPKAQGEQQAIEAALETYLRDTTGKVNVQYTLQYPSEGEYTTAFIVCDAQVRPLTDGVGTAALAVAFYTLSSEPDATHINLLRRSGNEWFSVSDRAGFGADVMQVAFGDLDGDGVNEILTGWDIYNTRDHRLTALTVGDELIPLAGDALYTQLYVGKMPAGEQDSLLLLRIGGANEVTATLETAAGGALVSRGSVRLDGYIQQFGSMTLCRLAEGVHGLYVEAVKSGGTVVTELIYYDDTGLHAPFYNADGNVTDATTRPGGIAAADADGDGLLEIPLGQPLPGYEGIEELPSYARLTDWMAWDYASGEWSRRLSSIVHIEDGYQVILNDVHRQTVTASYDEDSRMLTLTDSVTGEAWLRVSLTALPQGDNTLLLYPAEGDRPACRAWYDPAVLNEEEVRYMVARYHN